MAGKIKICNFGINFGCSYRPSIVEKVEEYVKNSCIWVNTEEIFSQYVKSGKSLHRNSEYVVFVFLTTFVLFSLEKNCREKIIAVLDPFRYNFPAWY